MNLDFFGSVQASDQPDPAILSAFKSKERCLSSISGFISTDDQRRPVTLALSSPPEFPSQSALFVIDRPSSGPVPILFALPVYQNLILKPSMVSEPGREEDRCIHIVGSSYLSIGDNTDAIEFYTKSGPSFDSFTSKADDAINMAVRDKLNKNGTSHEWMINYVKKQQQQEAKTDDELDNFLVRSANAFGTTGFKDEWIGMMLKDRESEFTELLPIKICCGTYNVNGKTPRDEYGNYADLRPWLNLQSDSVPDIYVIAFQELDLSTEAFLFNESDKEEEWTRAFESSVGKQSDFVKLRSKQLVAMLLMIYVRRNLVSHIKNIYADAQGTGLLGMMGNKGGVSIRFSIYNTTICFINSHLAAHDNAIVRRNLDHQEICRRITFIDNIGRSFGIFDHDHIIWLGDLNYRINNLNDSEIKSIAKSPGPYDKLLDNDQLKMQRKLGNTFVEFNELPITFPPTYKYDPGTDDFDSSEKQRSPAYCDRILYYKNKEDNKITQTEYTSHPQLRLSDHKPVRAVFNVKVKLIDRNKEREVFYNIVRQLDTIENKAMPDVTLSNNTFSFENIEYLKPQSQTFELCNIAQVPARFSFIPKLEEKHYCKPWMEISPPSGLLRPGQKQTITISVLVDDDDVAVLNEDPSQFDDILIMHLENGKDYFLVISGTFIKTSFGRKLESLLEKLPPPPPSEDQPTPMLIPTELWILTDHLFKYGLDELNLFLFPGDAVQMEQIRARIDSKQLILQGTDVLSVAETYIQFLNALPDSIIPKSMYSRCCLCSNSPILSRQLVNDLNAFHHDAFLYILFFLREVLRHSSRNKLSAESLALVFGCVMIRSETPPHPGSPDELVANKRKQAFLLQFLSSTPPPPLPTNHAISANPKPPSPVLHRPARPAHYQRPSMDHTSSAN